MLLKGGLERGTVNVEMAFMQAKDGKVIVELQMDIRKTSFFYRRGIRTVIPCVDVD